MEEKLEIKIEITKSDDGEFNLEFVGDAKTIKSNHMKMMAYNFNKLFKQNLKSIFDNANHIASLEMNILNCSCNEDDEDEDEDE